MNEKFEKILNDLWKIYGHYYSSQLYKQTKVPKKYQGIKVCARVELHKKGMGVFLGQNTDKASIKYQDCHDDFLIPQIKLSMKFWIKEGKEWYNSGCAFGNYVIVEDLSEEELNEFNGILNTEITSYFEQKQNEKVIEDEKRRIEYNKYEERKECLNKRLETKTINKDEAIELLNIYSDEKIQELIKIIYE